MQLGNHEEGRKEDEKRTLRLMKIRVKCQTIYSKYLEFEL